MSGVIEIADETVEGGDPLLSWFAPNFFRPSPVFSHRESAPGALKSLLPGARAPRRAAWPTPLWENGD